jgi:SAM-dependent methyltransferase
MNFEKFQRYTQQALSTVYSEVPGGFHDQIIIEFAQRFLPDFALQSNACIIDIGCGAGLFAQAAHKLGYQDVTGVTLSAEDVSACESTGLKITHADMSDLPWADGSVDFIWCRHALEHSPYPLFTLYEFHRVLKPDGQMFIEVPAPGNERVYIHEFNPNHYSILGDRMWQGLFIKANFELFQDWVYDINLQLDHKTVNEKSLMFALRPKV